MLIATVEAGSNWFLREVHGGGADVMRVMAPMVLRSGIVELHMNDVTRRRHPVTIVRFRLGMDLPTDLTAYGHKISALRASVEPTQLPPDRFVPQAGLFELIGEEGYLEYGIRGPNHLKVTFVPGESPS